MAQQARHRKSKSMPVWGWVALVAGVLAGLTGSVWVLASLSNNIAPPASVSTSGSVYGQGSDRSGDQDNGTTTDGTPTVPASPPSGVTATPKAGVSATPTAGGNSQRITATSTDAVDARGSSTGTVEARGASTSAADARGHNFFGHLGNGIPPSPAIPRPVGLPPGATDRDLAITAGVSPSPVPATGASGASVTFTKPTASDEDGAVAVTCDHTSGGTFAVGTTTVYCSATSPDDTNGSPAETVSTTLTITVLGRSTQLQDLRAEVTGIGPGASLSAKVQIALNRELAGDLKGTCSALTSLINEARPQTDKHLTSAQATAVITAANRIQLVSGC